MSFSKGLGFRLENIEGAAAAENYDAEESLAIDNESAAAVGEAEMVGQETDELGTAMDASVDAAEELGTEVIPAMSEAAADDGFTPREAEQVQARLESICRRAGIDFASTGLTMRRESFGSAASRKTQTRMRLEAAEGVFAKIWENLKKAWAWLKDQLGAIWSKWTKNAESVQKRLKDIQLRITKLPSGAKPDKSRLKTQARFFSMNRKVVIDQVLGSINAMDGIASSLRTELSNNKVADLQASFGSNGGVSSGGLRAGREFIASIANKVVDPLKAFTREEAGISRNYKPGASKTNSEKNEIVRVSGVFPSGRALVISKTSVAAGAESSAALKIAMEVVEDSFAEDYDAPKTAKEISELVVKGLSMANALIKADKSKKELESVIKGVMDICDNNAKTATTHAESEKNSDKDEIRDAITIRVALLRAMQEITKTIGTEMPKMQFEAAHALAEMSAAAVSNMKEDTK